MNAVPRSLGNCEWWKSHDFCNNSIHPNIQTLSMVYVSAFIVHWTTDSEYKLNIL